MIFSINRIALTLFWLSLTSIASAVPNDRATEVLVYGSTPAGIAAAISASDAGHQVLLIEPTSRIGGLLTNGLSHSDFRSRESLSGFFWDFAKRVQSHYRETYGDDSDQIQHCFGGVHGEPSVNLEVLEAMLAERSSVRVVKATVLLAVQMSDFQRGRRRIISATFSGDLRVSAKQFIDASYEGDLMAMTGENFHIGRESRAQYGEPLAGDVGGQADGQVQGYNYRFIMTQVESNKLMPSAPEGYDREDFARVLSHFESRALIKVFSDGHDGIYRAHLPLLPNGKADVNDTPRAPVRLSMPDINDAYPGGDAKTRTEIVRQHLYYNVGLLYFLQNDDAVPPEIQADARSWGFCKDEFQSTGGIPEQLYIREARRLVGQHVFTENDTLSLSDDARTVLHSDSIACGDYVHNCHGTGRIGSRFDGEHEGEFYKPVPPYQILYGVICPTETANLLVPVACSASHFGFGALRLEPIWCSLGQAAGEAASLAIETNVIVQAVDVPRLQARLHANRSATIYVSDVPPDSPDFAAVQWFGTHGGLHGLAGANQPKAESLGGQYSKAHPGHAVELDLKLDRKTYDQWNKLVTLPAFSEGLTRREVIAKAYQSHCVAIVTKTPGLVAFWDFVKREPDGDRRFTAHVSDHSHADYPLDAANYVKEFWGEGREARYDDFPLLGRGPFGQAIRIVKEDDAKFRPFLFVPRSRLHGTPLDIKGAGKSVTVVVWAIRESGNHALAGIWHEGTDLEHAATDKLKVERGQRQYALFAGLNKGGSACGHVSENGGSSFMNKYALHKCNSVGLSPEVSGDAATELLDKSWQCFAMTFDDDRDEMTGWLNGDSGDRWLENPKQDGLIASAYDAYMQGHFHSMPGQQQGEDEAFPEDQYYNPPEDTAISVEVISKTEVDRVEVRVYRYTKVRVTLRDGKEVTRDLVALRLNPWWYPHGIYEPKDATTGGPFTIGRVIHSSRSVGFTGWISGVAVYDRALRREEIQTLSDLRNTVVGHCN